MLLGEEYSMINKISDIYYMDVMRSTQNQSILTDEEQKNRRIEHDAMRFISLNDIKTKMMQGQRNTSDACSKLSTEKTGSGASTPAPDNMKAKFESIVMGFKTAEAKNVPGNKRIDIRLTEDGVQQDNNSIRDGAKDDPAAIIDISVFSRNAS